MASVTHQILLGTNSGTPAVATTGSNFVSSTTNATAYTFNDVSGLGSHANVLLTPTAQGTAARTVSTLTVEGSSAAMKVQNSTGFQNTEIWAINESTTAPDVVITWSGACLNCGTGVVGCTGIISLTPVATNSSDTDPAALNVNTTADGIVIACGIGSAGGTMTWTGVTEFYDTVVDSLTQTGGFDLTPTTETPRTVSGNWSGAGTDAAVSASFR